MIVVNYHDDLNEVQGDPALLALVSAPAAAAPFHRLEWWRNLRDNCALAPLIVVARDGADRAVLPLAAGGRRLHGLENWYNFELAPLFTPAADRAAMARAIAVSLAARAGRVTLCRLAEDDAALLGAAFAAQGWLATITPYDHNHVLAVGGRSYADFLATRPGPLRTTLARKQGRVTVEILDRFCPAAWAEFEAVYAASWKPAEGSPAFVRRLAEEEGAAGRLRLGLACRADAVIAAQVWTVEYGTAFIHKLAYRADAAGLSPGTTLTARLMEHVIDRDRVEMVDFGTGDDAYKRDWMDARRLRVQLDLMRPGDPRNWPALARHALRRIAGRR